MLFLLPGKFEKHRSGAKFRCVYYDLAFSVPDVERQFLNPRTVHCKRVEREFRRVNVVKRKGEPACAEQGRLNAWGCHCRAVFGENHSGIRGCSRIDQQHMPAPVQNLRIQRME